MLDKNMKTLTLLTVLLVLVTICVSAAIKSSNGNFELLILHNNDMHSRFDESSQNSGECTKEARQERKCYGGFARVAHVVKEKRKLAQSGLEPPVLFLNAGDTYTGTAWFAPNKWKITTEFVNALQPDAISLGNHEFDYGIEGLTPFIENLTCPVLAANLVLAKEPKLEAQTNLMKSYVFDVNGTKIGVIGYLTPLTKSISQKTNVEYIDEIDAIKAEAAKLKSQGINILIALGHSGFEKDMDIAEKVEDIDLVIGGHSNTFLWNGTVPDVEKSKGFYPTRGKQSKRLVPVVQAYAYTKYLGELRLIFNAEGEIVHYDRKPILLDNTIPQDPKVLSIVNRYRIIVKNYTETVVGNTSVILEGPDACRLRECNTGNLITDAMVHKYLTIYKEQIGWTDAPIAIMQGGGIRNSFKHLNLPTNLTLGDLYSVIPFNTDMVKVSVNGSTILKMLEHAVDNYKPKELQPQF